MRDTLPGAKDRYFALLRSQSPLERLNKAVELSQMVRQLARSAILAKHPQASPDEVRFHLADRLYGHDVACRLFPKANGV